MLKKEFKMGKNAFAVAGVCAVMVAGVCNAGLTQVYAEDTPAAVAPAGAETPEQVLENAKHDAATALEQAAQKAENTIKALNLDANAKQEAIDQITEATQKANTMVHAAKTVDEVNQAKLGGITIISGVESDAKANAAGEGPQQGEPANPGVPEVKPEVGPGPVKPEDKTPAKPEDKTPAKPEDKTSAQTEDKKMSKDAKKAQTPATSDSAIIGSAAVISAIGSAMAVLGIKSKENN